MLKRKNQSNKQMEVQRTETIQVLYCRSLGTLTVLNYRIVKKPTHFKIIFQYFNKNHILY